MAWTPHLGASGPRNNKDVGEVSPWVRGSLGPCMPLDLTASLLFFCCTRETRRRAMPHVRCCSFRIRIIRSQSEQLLAIIAGSRRFAVRLTFFSPVRTTSPSCFTKLTGANTVLACRQRRPPVYQLHRSWRRMHLTSATSPAPQEKGVRQRCC
jgi:hypothetical protein